MSSPSAGGSRPLDAYGRFLRWLGRRTFGWPGAMRALRLAHSPERAGRWYYEDVVEVRDGVKLRLASGSWTEWQALFLGSQDPVLSAFLEGRDWSGGVALDVGANYGYYSALLARRCRKVHAFEPLPRMQERLRHNVELNGFGNVSVHPVALSDAEGEATFHEPDPGEANQGTGSLVCASTGGTIRVRTRTLDSMAAELDLEGLSVVKIDVEGAEDLVIRGALKTLERHRPVVVFENNVGSHVRFGEGESTLQSASLLFNLGYQLHTLEGRPLDEVPPMNQANDLVAIPSV